MGQDAPSVISRKLALACNVSLLSTVKAFDLSFSSGSAVSCQVPRLATSEVPIVTCYICTQCSHLLRHLLHSLLQSVKVVISWVGVDLIH